MKNSLLIVFVNLLILGGLSSQSTTFEITPDFHLNESEYKTIEIPFIQPNEAIDFVGLSCYHLEKRDEGIYFRLLMDNQWTSWTQFEQQYEFVNPIRKAYRTAPIESLFSAIQFKTEERLESELTVRFFLAEVSEATTQEAPHITPIVTQRAADCELPEACYRECWCPTCPADTSPEFTEPTHLIVHHSAGNNESSNFATVVEFIWDLHTNTNGWDDIGYNWLIDPNGVLYEGRPDGYQGAHFSCINENTVGICVIGDYTLVQPEEAAIVTLINLLAYEATEHMIDITTASYHVTGDFNLDNIAGHRESSGSSNACSSTECPGNSFYPLLADIRLQVSELPCYSGLSSTWNESTLHNIQVFPNPVQQKLFISSAKHLNQPFEIIDLQGKSIGVVQSGKANDVSYLDTGIYFLTYNGALVTKIVKD